MRPYARCHAHEIRAGAASNVDNEDGGNEAALMSIEDGGVYLVMLQVKDSCPA